MPSESVGTLRLASPARDLAVYAERAARHDPATPVRLVAAGHVLAAFVSTPFDCLALRTCRLADSASIDVVVEAVGLGARARSAAADGLLAVPPRLPDITWAQPLPPRSGWQELGTVPSADVAARVVTDTDEFRLRSTQVGSGRQAATALEGIAQELWARPLVGDAPARLAHAADYLGFVDGEGDAVVRECGAWRRLDTRTGVTLSRVADPLGLFVR